MPRARRPAQAEHGPHGRRTGRDEEALGVGRQPGLVRVGDEARQEEVLRPGNKWEQNGIGLYIDGIQLNHAAYADNVILLAETEPEATVMIDIARGITAAGYVWKLDSLEGLPCGDLTDLHIQLQANQHDEQLPFKVFNSMQLLGNRITNNANTHEAMKYRQSQNAMGNPKRYEAKPAPHTC